MVEILLFLLRRTPRETAACFPAGRVFNGRLEPFLGPAKPAQYLQGLKPTNSGYQIYPKK
jgi:hypothetical protein